MNKKKAFAGAVALAFAGVAVATSHSSGALLSKVNVLKPAMELAQTQSYLDRFIIEAVVPVKTNAQAKSLVEQLVGVTGLKASFVSRAGRFVAIHVEGLKTQEDQLQAEKKLKSLVFLRNVHPQPKRSKHSGAVYQNLYQDSAWIYQADMYEAGFNGNRPYNVRIAQFMDKFKESAQTGLTGKTGVTAILDSGSEPSPVIDLANVTVANGNFDIADADLSNPSKFNDTRDTDPSSVSAGGIVHGVAVGALVAGLQNNLNGIAGIVANQKLTQVKVFSSNGDVQQPFALENSIRWAAGLPVEGAPANPHPAKVINMSIGSNGDCFPSTQSAVDDAIAAGAILVASTGNNGFISRISEPASCKGVVSVGSVDIQGNQSFFSNSDDFKVVTSTFGEEVASVQGRTEKEVAYVSGTSFSSPTVAAVISAVARLKPSVTASEVISALTSTGPIIEPYSVGLSDGSTQTICNDGSCGRRLDAMAFLAQIVPNAVNPDPMPEQPPVQEPPVQEPPVQEPPAQDPPVQDNSIKFSKPLASQYTDVSNVEIFFKSNSGQNNTVLVGTTASFNEQTGAIDIVSEQTGEFVVNFRGKKVSNTAAGRSTAAANDPLFTFEVILSPEGTQSSSTEVSEVGAQQPISNPDTPVNEGGNQTASGSGSGGGGGGAMSLFGLLGLFAALSVFKAKKQG